MGGNLLPHEIMMLRKDAQVGGFLGTSGLEGALKETAAAGADHKLPHEPMDLPRHPPLGHVTAPLLSLTSISLATLPLLQMPLSLGASE